MSNKSDRKGDSPSEPKRGTASEQEAESIASLILNNEEWLMERVLFYAQLQNYTQYTSTLICAWRLSISGLSDAIVAVAIGLDTSAIEFEADDNFAGNRLAQFAVEEALLHRKRGINLGMFLGLLKYYRQAYLDLIQVKQQGVPDIAARRHIIHRCFDLFEISLVSEWNSTSLDAVVEELRVTNRMLTNEKNFYLTAYESLKDPAFLLDSTFNISAANQAAKSLIAGSFVSAGQYYYDMSTGHARSSAAGLEEVEKQGKALHLVGQSIFAVMPELKGRLVDQEIDAPVVYEELSMQIHGRSYDFLLSQSPMQDVSGRFSGSIVFLTDITDRKHMEDELRDLSEHDPLTGAYNRRYLFKFAEVELKRAQRYGWPICAVALDIDHFKSVNDTYGHAVGDDLLVQLTKTCVSVTREHDIVARTGGEEFLILLPQTKLSEAEGLVERLQRQLISTPLLLGKTELRITASFGLASLPADAADIESLLNAADGALYAAKAAGRNCLRRADKVAF